MKQIFHTIQRALVFTAAAGMVACGIDMPQTTQTSYETLTVEKSDIVLPMRFSAKMKGEHDVNIMPQVSGQLMQICVTEGQQVQKGATLFVIDSRNAELELEAAEANLLAAQANESSAKMEWESNKNLFAKNIVSRYMLDNSENNYKQAQAAVSQARASVNRAKVNLGFCTITAPVTGVIGGISVHVGDQVSPATQLTMLSGNEQMQAEFSLNESLIEDQVSMGLTKKEVEQYLRSLPDVTFVMKNGTEYPHKGRITSLTGVVDATTGTLACKATFPNPEGHLFSGIQGTVVLPLDEKDVMIIPQVAVVRLQDKRLVYVVQPDSTVVSVTITTEDTGNGKDVIVTSGLKVGDRIVTVGANNVQEGQRVLFD
ncbi:MAG: efflux RND transporter periplasmic adaptor subunit [Paludibacteraceae bacterium]|nr:efflux RND transporter periplasmic adaptor subunit [Paludibacteraceae bacterium]